MGQVTTLLRVIETLDTLNEEDTIYVAEPWHEDAKALVAFEPLPKGTPEDALRLGLKYFLEVIIAKEFLEEWAEHVGTKPSLHDACERLIQYAINDA